MIENNYFVRRSEFHAAICPKTAKDESHPAWMLASSLVVTSPFQGDKEVLINFRTTTAATSFCNEMKPFDHEKAFFNLPRKEQPKSHTPADAVALFWNNLYARKVEDRCLPEEPQGNRIFKLPLFNEGEFILLDCASMYRYQDRPANVYIPWSNDWNEGKINVIEEDAAQAEPGIAGQMDAVIKAFRANMDYPKGKIFSPIVAHVEDQGDSAKIVMQVMMETPKEEYEVEITNPQGKKFKGLLVIDPSKELKGN